MMTTRPDIARRSTIFWFAAPLLLSACASAPAPTRPSVEATDTKPEALPVAAPSAASQAEAISNEPAPDPGPPSPFSPLIINTPDPLDFYTLKRFGVAITRSYFPLAIRVDDTGARADGQLLESAATPLGEGQPFMVVDLSGDLQENGSLVLNLPGDRGGTDIAFAWKGSKWQRLPGTTVPLDAPIEVNHAYYNGGLMHRASYEGRILYEIVRYRESDDAAFPAFYLGGGKGAAPKLPEMAKGKGKCPTALISHAGLVTLPWGELIGFGKTCDDGGAMSPYGEQSGDGPLVIERWAKGSSKSKIEILPDSKARVRLASSSVIFAHGTNDIDLVANQQAMEGDEQLPYLAHYDGKAWTRVPLDAKEEVRSLVRAADGSTWLTLETHLRRKKTLASAWEVYTPEGLLKAPLDWAKWAPDGSLWARQHDQFLHFTFVKDGEGRWETVPLPKIGKERPMPEAIYWVGQNPYIVTSAPNALLGLGAPKQVFDYEKDLGKDGGNGPAEEAKSKEQPAFGRVTQATPTCKELFVVLYKLSKVAPPDFDFPLTRAALKGHTELSSVSFAETEDFGRRYLVAFVPDFKTAQKLLGIVKEGVKGSTPQILCGKPPKTNRAVRIDLRTGDLVK